MATDDLEWLATWYTQQCNGRWEHQKGMLLEPVANAGPPNWRLRIDLRGTSAAGFAPRRLNLCEFDTATRPVWLRCTLDAQRFEGVGAEVELLISVFRGWVGPSADPDAGLEPPAGATLYGAVSAG